MAEPIGPEVYLAIATSVQKAVNNYRDKKRVEQNHKLVSISTDSSKSSLTLPADELLSCSGLKIGNDGYVQWALDSPLHPRNWSRGRKAYDLGLILFLEFVMSAISAGGTPASMYGLGVLGHRREVGLVGFTTMYLLGQALGLLLLSPYSDKFERRTLYIASAFLYSVFCLPVAATSNIAGVFVGRLITGVISANPALTARRSIQDLFGTEAHMWAFFSWALVTNLGLVLGPIYASYVSFSLDWRWPFYLATIIVAVTGMLMYFIRESHTSQLLKRKVVAIQSHRADLILRTAPTPPPSIIQPLILLVTKPTVFLSSLTNAFRTALLYLFAVAFPLIYTHYTWSRQKTTLIFLFIVPGLLLSTLTQLHTHHKIRKYRLAKRRPNPSTYLFNLFIGAPALAIALWWFAWTIPSAHVNSIGWPASAVSLILLGCGINAHSTALPLYVLAPSRKSAHDDAAIASASFTAMLVTKALLCAVFPLFTQEMFENLGNNVAGSVLAAVATVFCVIPFILFRFGEKWRGGSGVGSSSGGMDDDEEVKMEEKRSKPKKTVRWGDEMDSSSGSDGSSEQTSQSDTHISESASVSGSSELSRTETETDTVTETEADTSGGPSSSEVPALSRSKTHISTRDFATVTTTETPHHTQTENEIENRNEVSPPLSKVSTQQDSTQPSSRSSSSSTSDPPHTASDTTTSVRTETGTSSNSSNSSGRADGKKEKAKKRKEETRREDDMDNGRAGGLWGMDLERMAVLPYF